MASSFGIFALLTSSLLALASTANAGDPDQAWYESQAKTLQTAFAGLTAGPPSKCKQPNNPNYDGWDQQCLQEYAKTIAASLSKATWQYGHSQNKNIGADKDLDSAAAKLNSLFSGCEYDHGEQSLVTCAKNVFNDAAKVVKADISDIQTKVGVFKSSAAQQSAVQKTIDENKRLHQANASLTAQLRKVKAELAQAKNISNTQGCGIAQNSITSAKTPEYLATPGSPGQMIRRPFQIKFHTSIQILIARLIKIPI